MLCFPKINNIFRCIFVGIFKYYKNERNQFDYFCHFSKKMAEVLTAAVEMTAPQDDGCFSLTYTERLIGFGITGVCGLVAGILSVVAVFILNMRKFVVLFTLSSILYLISLCLLIGFKRICSSFTDPKRIYSALGMLGGTIITLYFGLFKKWIILSIVGFLIEFVSFIYYALTFIPGGERLFHLLLF